jgi:hypothetical protein
MSINTRAGKSRTVSTKVNHEELAKLDDLALQRGVKRSYLVKELIQAALEGRVILPVSPSMFLPRLGGASATSVHQKQARRR